VLKHGELYILSVSLYGMHGKWRKIMSSKRLHLRLSDNNERYQHPCDSSFDRHKAKHTNRQNIVRCRFNKTVFKIHVCIFSVKAATCMSVSLYHYN